MWSNCSQSGSSYFLHCKRRLRGITTESDLFLPMMLPSSWIFARIAFYPSLLWGIATESSTKRWYDRIDTHVILGALPFKSQTREVSVIKFHHVLPHHYAPINVNPMRGGGECGQGVGIWQILKFFYQIPQGGKRKVNQKSQKSPHPRGKNLNKQYYNTV